MQDPLTKTPRGHVVTRGAAVCLSLALLLVLACGDDAEEHREGGHSMSIVTGADEGGDEGGGMNSASGTDSSEQAGPDSIPTAGNPDLPESGTGVDETVGSDEIHGEHESEPEGPRISVDELVAGLDVVPEELAVVVDPGLLLPTDPPDFPVSATVGGEPVEIQREYHPTSGVLLAIALVRPQPSSDTGSGTDDGEVGPILHGPQWRYYETAALRAVQWFRDGVAHGPSRQWRRVGTMVYEGRFADGERDGLRREYAKNGQLISVRVYAEGTQEGTQEDWFPSGQRKESAEFLGGELHGSRKAWGREGLLVLDETYEHGVLHGRWSDFHPKEGTPREWGTHAHGKRGGIWQRGSPDGSIIASVEYRDGMPHGRSQTWNLDGTLVEESTMVEGVKTGTSRTWYADGTPQSEGRLENNLRVGRWMYWKSDGSVNERWTGIYEDDLRSSDLDD